MRGKLPNNVNIKNEELITNKTAFKELYDFQNKQNTLNINKTIKNTHIPSIFNTYNNNITGKAIKVNLNNNNKINANLGRIDNQSLDKVKFALQNKNDTKIYLNENIHKKPFSKNLDFKTFSETLNKNNQKSNEKENKNSAINIKNSMEYNSNKSDIE